MSNTLKYATLAVFIGAAGVAQADPAETKGGIKVKTEDGRFEATVGGRIQFDYYLFSEDEGARAATNAAGTTSAPFGTAVAANGTNRGGAQFRRTYLTLTGKAYGWDYKFEHDFTAATGGPATREMWIGTPVGPGKLIIGQHKPFRGMEELASSNEITFMERPNTSATGIYGGRQFLTGLFYKGNTDTYGYGVYGATLSSSNAQNATEGHSFGARAYYFPLSEDGRTIHLGLAYSSDREDTNANTAAPVFQYGGRRGNALTLGGAGASLASGFGTQNTIHAELAGAFGPFTAQAEYAIATLENAYDIPAGAQDQDAEVTAFYVQAGYFITGEKKVYKKDRGAFGSPKPNNSYGAVEAVVRYESSKFDDTVAGQARGCAVANAPTPGYYYRKCDASQLTVGANWYVNPNVRFMLNYYLAEADIGSSGSVSGKDEPEAISLRAQFGF